MSGATPEPRTAVMILVEASWLDNSGTLRSVQARMENRSAHGACIRIKAKVGVGARLYIRSHREQFSGIAKYCRVDGKEFLVGIHKDAVNWPIPKMLMPVKAARIEERGPEPRRDSVSHRGTASRVVRQEGTNYRAPTGVGRIEEPIAARLLEHDARRTESPPGEALPNAHPASAANAAQQVSAGNGFEKKAKRKGRGIMKLKCLLETRKR